MDLKKAPKLYFPGLNGLRFIAAFSVFIAHVEHFVKEMGGTDIKFYIISQLGGSGVNLFFVISGYLITYLLMVEKDSYGEISLRNFYVRRILRIWPLYYFILIVTMLVIPLMVSDSLFLVNGMSSIRSFLLFIFFMPFVSMCIYPTNFMANVLWSVGVEEMYYLFWPLIIKARKKITLSLFVGILVIFLLVKGAVTYLPYKVNKEHDILSLMSGVLSVLRVDNMIIGGMMAYIALNVPSIMRIIQNKIVFCLSVLALGYFLFIGFFSFYFGINPIVRYLVDPVIYALLCGVIVVNVTHSESLSKPLESKFLYEMGQISYGFYVYHSVALFLVIRLFVNVIGMEKAGLPIHILLYVAGFALTAAMSYLSYHYFEAKFLLLKKRFTTVISGNDARKADEAGTV